MRKVNIFKIIKILLLTILISLLLGYGFLQTGVGKKMLAQLVSAQLSNDNKQITITRIKGHVPFNFSIKQVRIAEGEQDILLAENISLNWLPMRLIQGEIVINQLKAEKISWLKKFTPQPKKTAQSSWNRLFPKVAIGTVSIPNIIIAEKILTDEELQLQLEIAGDVRQMMNFKGKLLVVRGVKTELAFNFAPNSRSSFLLDVELHEQAGGLVGGLIKLPQKQAINLKSSLKGDLQSLSGELNLQLGEQLLANVAIITDYQNHLSIKGGGDLPDFVAIPTIITGRNWEINASIAQQNEVWQIESSRISLANLSMNATGEASAQGIKLIPEIALQTSQQTYAANGEITANFIERKINANLKTNLKTLPPQLHTWFGENANATLNLLGSGSFEKPELILKIAANKLTISPKLAHLQLGNKADLELTLNSNIQTKNFKVKTNLISGAIKAEVSGNFTNNSGNFNLDLTHAELSKISLSSNFKLKKSATLLEDANFEINGTKAIAKTWNLTKNIGEIEIYSSDIAPLAAWIGDNESSGKINAKANFQAENLSLNADAQNLMMPKFALEANILKLELNSPKNLKDNLQQLNAKLFAENSQIGELAISQAILSLENGDLNAKINGENAGEKIELNAQAAMRTTKDEYIGNIVKIEGEYAGYAFNLKAPTTFNFKNAQNWDLQKSLIEVAKNDIEIRGEQTANNIDFQIKLANLPLKPLLVEKIPTMGEVNLSANATIQGSPKNPEVKIEAQLLAQELGKLTNNEIAPQNLTLNFAGNIAGKTNIRQLKATTSLKSGAEKLGSGKLELPIIFSLQPFNIAIQNASPISGDAHLEVALSRFNSWLAPLGHRIKANLIGDLKMQGSAQSPIMIANLNLTDADYTNLATGICMRSGNIKAEYNALNQFILNNFNATGDNSEGSIKANGIADFAANTINFKTTANNAAIFCSPMLDGEISGDAALSGTMQAMNLGGDFTVGKTSILIPSSGKTAIPRVEKAYRHQLYAKKYQANKVELPINLDLKINAPNQIFVRGRGLDAEFGGDLKITGTASKPQIIGKLASKRGRLALLGSTINIDSGEIKFMEGAMQKPYLQLLGSTKASGTKINVELVGDVLKPKLTLSSTPSIPNDEILALLLFGRPLDKISPFQALQLAQAAQSLASGESGTGMLGSAREVLGVDSLNIGEGSDGSPTLGAGKYVTDKIFVGIEQGTTPESRRISTEIEVTPNVTAKTSTNSRAEPSASLEWRYDY